MFLDLCEPHFVLVGILWGLKNSPGPIRSSRHSLVLHRLPEKCSWTYYVVYFRPRSVDSTGIMFVELSRRCLPLSPNCANPKNVPGSISGSLRSLAAHHANRNNVPRPIGNFKPSP